MESVVPRVFCCTIPLVELNVRSWGRFVNLSHLEMRDSSSIGYNINVYHAASFNVFASIASEFDQFCK